MRSKYKEHKILLAIATTFFAAGIWGGCTVGFETDQSGVFPCETDDDCLEGFECSGDPGNMVCEKRTVANNETAPPCDQEGNPEGDIDLDNDGYGTGDNRTNCPVSKRERDCKDTGENAANVNPGQPELCDGIDNNCDGEGADGAHQVDEFDCNSASIDSGDTTIAEECGDSPFSYLKYECINDTCTLRPFVQDPNVRCDEMFITCNSAEQSFTYELDGQTYTPADVPDPDCR